MNFSVLNKAILHGHRGSIYGLGQGVDESNIASVSGDKRLLQWDIHTLESSFFSIQFPSVPYCFSKIEVQNNYFLAGLSSGNLIQVDIETKKEKRNIVLNRGAIFCIQHFRDENLIGVGSEDGSLHFLDAQDLKLVAVVQLGKGKIRSLYYDSEKGCIYVACGDGKCYLVFIDGFKMETSFDAHQLSCNSVCMMPGGNFLLTGGRDARLNIFDSQTFKMLDSIPAHNYAIYSVLYLSKFDVFVTASRDKNLKLWSGQNVEFLLRLDKEKYNGHGNSVNALCWKENENLLFSAGDDKTLIAWEFSHKAT